MFVSLGGIVDWPVSDGRITWFTFSEDGEFSYLDRHRTRLDLCLYCANCLKIHVRCRHVDPFTTFLSLLDMILKIPTLPQKMKRALIYALEQRNRIRLLGGSSKFIEVHHSHRLG